MKNIKILLLQTDSSGAINKNAADVLFIFQVAIENLSTLAKVSSAAVRGFIFELHRSSPPRISWRGCSNSTNRFFLEKVKHGISQRSRRLKNDTLPPCFGFTVVGDEFLRHVRWLQNTRKIVANLAYYSTDIHLWSHSIAGSRGIF